MTGLRKISVKMVVRDSFDNALIKKHPGVVSLTEFDESHIKHTDLVSSYSFDFLKDSAFQFVSGIWNAVKGFVGMAQWSVVLIIEGFKLLWKGAFGKW